MHGEVWLLGRFRAYLIALVWAIDAAAVMHAGQPKHMDINKSEPVLSSLFKFVQRSRPRPCSRFAGDSLACTECQVAQGFDQQEFAFVQQSWYLQRGPKQSMEFPRQVVDYKSAAPAQMAGGAQHYFNKDLAAGLHNADWAVGQLVSRVAERQHSSRSSWQNLKHNRAPNDHTSLVALEAEESPIDDISVRPHAKGAPEEIKFGLYAKEFYGASMIENEFTIDNIITLQWSDPRTTKLIPQGVKVLTLSEEFARQKMWMPDIEITNRGIRGYEQISSSVAINPDGLITKVERSLAVIKNKFKVEAFPFDDQQLTIKIASTALMSNELKLVNILDPGVSGVSDTLFEGSEFDLISFATSQYDEVDSTMTKSRGQMQIFVHRHINKYFQTHLLPSVLLLTISYGTFWLPFIPQFATPRMALSILALLSLLTVSLKTEDTLSPAAPFCWNGLFDQTLQWLMCLTVILNISAELVFHTLKLEDLGKAINNRCKSFWLVPALINLCVVFASTSGDLLAQQALVTRAVLLLSALCFALWAYKANENHSSRK